MNSDKLVIYFNNQKYFYYKKCIHYLDKPFMCDLKKHKNITRKKKIKHQSLVKFIKKYL